MTASRCLHHAMRIANLPTHRWADEVKALPTQCGNDDCTHGNCQKVCQEWLRVQFMRLRFIRREKQIDNAAQKRGNKR